MKSPKLHALGWQTLAKTIEREVNSIPIGFLNHQTDFAPLLRVLTPNSLKLKTSGDRAPSGLFTLPHSANDLISKIKKKYELFYEIWNTDYIPLIAKRQKWHFEEEDLKGNDICYFKLTDSVLSTKWLIGKVEFVTKSKDKKVRRVGISYRFKNEDGETKFNVVERPSREVVKLMNIDDTSLLDDIKAVQEAAKKILDNKKIVPDHELDKIIDMVPTEEKIIDIVPTEEKTIDSNKPDDDTKKNRKPDEETNTSTEEIKTPKKPVKRKSELEKLKIENWEEPVGKRKSRSNSTALSTINNSAFMSRCSNGVSTAMMFHVTDIGYEGDTELKMTTSVTDEQKTSHDGVADWEGLLQGETEENGTLSISE